jgi:hypothetical protein
VRVVWTVPRIASDSCLLIVAHAKLAMGKQSVPDELDVKALF